MNTTHKKLFIKTFGCQMNEYDSRRIRDALAESHDLIETQEVDDADVILLNTCSIREKAQEKVFSQLGQWRPLKTEKKHLVIGVGGCVASQEGDAILKRAPFVDLVFGPQTLHRLPDMLTKTINEKRAIIDTSFPEIEKFDCLPMPRADGVTAFVSIMEGCNKYCSYCVVPYTRGEEISRPFDDVLAEVVALAEQGVREITFLGQNVNDYRGPMHEGGIADLALLIEYAAEIKGLDRIRFTTSHPLAFSDNLIDAYANVPKLVNHLHLPVQSGSNRVLTAMKRGYAIEEFKTKIQKLRDVRPDIKISSDFIIGFPGETDDEFEETMNLIEEIGFDNSFSFIFSPRPGTPAAQMPDDIPMEIKKQRLQRLQNQLTTQAAAYSEAMIGTVQKILIEKKSKKNDDELSGRTECNRVVNFPVSNDEDENEESLIGQLIDVKIVAAYRNSLRGLKV